MSDKINKKNQSEETEVVDLSNAEVQVFGYEGKKLSQLDRIEVHLIYKPRDLDQDKVDKPSG